MNSINSLLSSIPGSALTLMATILIGSASPLAAETTGRPIDDFAQADVQPTGMPRMIIDDNQAGGQSKASTSFADGVMTVSGKIVPGRGSPGFVSMPLILSADGSPTDLSKFTGVQLRVKLASGSLLIQTSTADVTNFDYHSSAPITRDPDAFQVIKVPFASMKQVWSAPTPLNLKTVTSINLVSAGMAPDTISYQIDEISFY
ncbi:CIA30 family protein [Opitutaceae bacterium]|nr:CIA30 family protein [Opitutaceae bacterium]